MKQYEEGRTDDLKGTAAQDLAGSSAERAVDPSGTATGENMGGFDRYIDYEVVDEGEKKLGSLSCLWLDRSGQPAFLGIKTGWLFGKTHVVPADRVDVNQGSRRIRLPYSEDMIKGAPSFDTDKDLEPDEERQVCDYFKTGGDRMSETESRGAEGTTLGAETSTRAAGTDLGTEEAEAEEPATKPRFEQPSSSTRPGMEETRIPLSEEDVKIGKRSVEGGGVRLRKIVRTETVNQPVELQREEIVIERVPGGQAGQGGTAEAFSQQEVYIPLRREEAVVQKESRVREEVLAHKESHVERQEVSEQVRREDVEIEKEGQDVTQHRRGEEGRDLP